MPITQDSLIYQNPPGTTPVPVTPPFANVPPVSPPVPLGIPEESGLPLKSLLIRAGIGLVVLLILIALVIFVILPLFKGKGGGNEKVTLTYWGLWEDSRVMDTVIDDFERENKNITVKYTKMDSKQYRERVMTRLANDTGPDIYRYHNTWLPMIQKELLPLSKDAITPSEFQKVFYPVAQKDLVRNGAIYGIPLHIDTLAMFVNTKILSAAGLTPPKNWNDFVKVAREVTTVTDTGEIKTAGAALGGYGNVTHASDIISVLFLQSGTKLSDIQGTQEGAVSAMQFYTEFLTADAPLWDDRFDSSVRFFAQDKLAMYFGYSWDILEIKALNPELTFTVHPIPILPGGEPLTVASYWVEGVSSKTKYPKEAMLFMNFLSKKETAQKFYSEVVKSGREFGELYARKDLSDSLKENTLLYPFLQQAPYAQSSFFASSTNDGETGINTRMNVYLENAVNGITGGNNSSTQTAVETLGKGVTQVLGTYGQ